MTASRSIRLSALAIAGGRMCMCACMVNLDPEETF
jgi:hypothetical protein